MAEDVGDEGKVDSTPKLHCAVLACAIRGNFVLLGTAGGDIFEVRACESEVNKYF